MTGRIDHLDLIEVALPGGKVVFTTRSGGVSRGPWESLNLGFDCGDRAQSVIDNRLRLAGGIGMEPDRFRASRQVHGGRIQVHSEPIGEGPFLTPEAGLEEADGHFTEVARLPLVVTVADCAAVFVSGPRGVALLHCGWRGLLTDLIPRGAEATGGGEAVIGPCIGSCCFRVGREVRELFPADDGLQSDRLDIAQLASAQLAEAGITNVENVGRCTSCEEGDFFSYRRDGGVTGRQAAVAWRTGA